jgi:hypothetical protein
MHGIATFDFDCGGCFAAACLHDCIVRPAVTGRFVVLDLPGSGLLLRLNCP